MAVQFRQQSPAAGLAQLYYAARAAGCEHLAVRAECEGMHWVAIFVGGPEQLMIAAPELDDAFIVADGERRTVRAPGGAQELALALGERDVFVKQALLLIRARFDSERIAVLPVNDGVGVYKAA